MGLIGGSLRIILVVCFILLFDFDNLVIFKLLRLICLILQALQALFDAQDGAAYLRLYAAEMLLQVAQRLGYVVIGLSFQALGLLFGLVNHLAGACAGLAQHLLRAFLGGARQALAAHGALGLFTGMGQDSRGF